MPASPPRRTAWFFRHSQTAPDGTVDTVLAGFTDGREADEARIDWPGSREELVAAPGAFGRVHSQTVGGHLSATHVDLAPDAAEAGVGAAPPLAYVVVQEVEAAPQAVTMLAFSGQLADGTVLGPDAAQRLGLREQDQVAAVRWLAGSGQVHQLFVQPAWRRQRIGVKLLLAGELVRAAHGWPRLCGGEIRTGMGEALLGAVPTLWGSRVRGKQADSRPMDRPGAVPPAGPTGIGLRGRPGGR